MVQTWEKVVAAEEWDSNENIVLGPHTSHQYRIDPRHLCFVLARYKFCAKMLAGRMNVAEVGCGDAFGTALVAQTVESLTALDQDTRLIKSNRQRLDFLTNCDFYHQDILAAPLAGRYDGVYSIDVIEHIDQEKTFIENICGGLTPDGICIIGTPNVQAVMHASQSSRLGHVNLKSEPSLRRLMEKYFKTVFIFSMNDEVIHTGFYPMAHYLFGVGIGPKND